MFNPVDVMRYEPVDDGMTWAELKSTNLYRIYITYAGASAMAQIKANVDTVMAGRIPDKLIKGYGFTKHDVHAPYKTYQYLRVAMKRLATKVQKDQK